MDLDADILPGKSLGGLQLFGDALAALPQLEGNWVLHERPSADGGFTFYEADNLFMVSVDNADLRIRCLVAHAGYRGMLYGYIRTGMTVDALLEASPSSRRKAMHMSGGFLHLDLEESVAFGLPPHLDDLDHLSDLPGDLVLDALYVMPPARRRVIRKNGEPAWEYLVY